MATDQAAKIICVKPLENKDARWLNLVQLEYRALDGQVRTWEAVRRTTRPVDSAVDAVHIVAIRHLQPKPNLGFGGGHGEGMAEVLLEKQFRPPAGKVVIEFPAGLVDPGETVEECAVRELREETGYVGVVEDTVEEPLIFHSAPASSFSCASTVRVKIDLTKPENQNPKQKLEDGEIIECFWLPVKGLYPALRKLQAEGYAIDGKVGAFAEGIEASLRWL